MLNHKAQQVPSPCSYTSSLNSISSQSDFEVIHRNSDSSSYYSDEGSLSVAPETTVIITTTSPSPLPELLTTNETFLSFKERSLSPDDHMPLPPENHSLLPPSDHNPRPPSDHNPRPLSSDESIEIKQESQDQNETLFLTPASTKSITMDTEGYSTPYLIPSPKKPNQQFSFPEELNQIDRNKPSNITTLEPDVAGGIPRVGSWMNLRGPLLDVMSFSLPAENKEASKKEKDRSTPSPTVMRSVPWSAVSSLQ